LTLKKEGKVEHQQPSITAETIAMHRAAESMRPEDQRVCNDPLAIHFISLKRDSPKSPIGQRQITEKPISREPTRTGKYQTCFPLCMPPCLL